MILLTSLLMEMQKRELTEDEKLIFVEFIQRINKIFKDS
jgi:hypothetical protein